MADFPVVRDTFRPLFDELPGVNAFGFLSPKRKQALLELEAERAAEIDALDIGLDQSTPQNAFDQEQLRIMSEQFATAKAMLASNDPQMNALGRTMVTNLSQAVRAQTQQNETEARASQNAARTAEIASMSTNYERDLAFANDIRKDVVAPYVEQQDSYNKVIELLDSGERLGFEAAFTAFVQGIDNSVVREGERLIYGGANGVVAQAVDMFNKWAGGEASTRSIQALKNSAASLMNARLSTVQGILATYESQVTAFGGDTERVFSVVPKTLYTPAPIDRSAQQSQSPALPIEQPTEQPGAVIGPQGQPLTAPAPMNEAEHGLKSLLFDTASDAADYWSRAWSSYAAEETGASLHVDPNTGALWEQSATGEWREVTTTDKQRERNLVRLRLQQPGIELTPGQSQRLEVLNAPGRSQIRGGIQR